MKRFIFALMFLPTVVFAQTPTDFTAQVAAAKANQQLINDLWSQLQLARKQLATVQGAQAQNLKDLSDVQAKVASCKAF